MSVVRAYLLERLAAEGERGWLHRKPRETHTEIVRLVRAFQMQYGFYDDDAERYIEAAVGDLPEHFPHGHELRHPQTKQLGHEVYIAKGILADEASTARLNELLAEGYVPLDDTLVEGEPYTVRFGQTFVGREVAEYGQAFPVRAKRQEGKLVLVPKGSRSSYYSAHQDTLVRKGWEA